VTHSTTLLCPLALLATGCLDDEFERVRTRLDDAVQLGTRDPGLGCCGLEGIEVRSGKEEPSTLETVRAYAAGREANYVVIDAFRVDDSPGHEEVLTRARLFRCPRLAQLAP
jgi:hypothetical protein